jgi:hypothetical protein
MAPAVTVDGSADLLAQLGRVSMYLDEACDWVAAGAS